MGPTRRLAKSTLLLIPLFGVHYVVFLSESIAEVYKIFFDLALGSFQVRLINFVFVFILLQIIVNYWIEMMLDFCGRVWWWLSSTAFSTLRWVLALPSTTLYNLTSTYNPWWSYPFFCSSIFNLIYVTLTRKRKYPLDRQPAQNVSRKLSPQIFHVCLLY